MIISLNSQFYLKLPAVFVSALGLKAGAKFHCSLENSTILLRYLPEFMSGEQESPPFCP